MAGKRSSVDYYEVLGVGPEATGPEIRRAYRRLAFQRHPDRNPGDPAAAERFREISEAYAVLSGAARRAEYDRARRTGAAGTFRVDREDLFRDLFADARAAAVFEELARDFERMGMRVDRHYFRQTLFGGRAVVTGGIFIISPLSPVLALLKLARAALAGKRRESVTGAERPALPAGGKVLSGLKRFGLRLLGVPSLPSPADSPDEDIFLPLVLTEGEAARGGRRRVTVERDGRVENLMVTVPAGVRSGTRLRLRGKGKSGGDLYLTIQMTGSDPD